MSEHRNDYDEIAEMLNDVLAAFIRNAHEPHDPLSDSITITKDGYIAGIVRLGRVQAWVEGLAESHRIVYDNEVLSRSTANQVEQLLDGYQRLLNASDSEMQDGDLARQIAQKMLEIREKLA